ncbi:MAG: class I SAM-dependent methyltransferase [Rhodospirillales bacterium]|nr:class I SAM-dependent methyltransferase [Rhodospirillales bacterium]MDP6805260.1 class I SAM-dependent methyltransferase [Rhodospirillales bacterium]
MGLATIMGFGRWGYFIPTRFAARAPRPGTGAPYDAIEAILRESKDQLLRVLDGLERFASEFEAIGSDPPPAPRWHQGWFPRLDAAVAYAMVRDRAPGRIVEVGSGHSTRFLARAVRDAGLATRLTAIDPRPRAPLAGLGVDHVAATLQEAGLAPFADLEPGDFVMVDSSHVMVPGSDADMIINRVLPALRAGVIIHFHDVFLPDDYPGAWGWRGYNEQQGVAPLIHGGGYAVLFASHFVATRMADAVARSAAGSLTLFPGALESSLWLEKRAV